MNSLAISSGICCHFRELFWDPSFCSREYLRKDWCVTRQTTSLAARTDFMIALGICPLSIFGNNTPIFHRCSNLPFGQQFLLPHSKTAFHHIRPASLPCLSNWTKSMTQKGMAKEHHRSHLSPSPLTPSHSAAEGQQNMLFCTRNAGKKKQTGFPVMRTVPLNSQRASGDKICFGGHWQLSMEALSLLFHPSLLGHASALLFAQISQYYSLLKNS